jgi:hypothetical protein
MFEALIEHDIYHDTPPPGSLLAPLFEEKTKAAKMTLDRSLKPFDEGARKSQLASPIYEIVNIPVHFIKEDN